MSPETHEQAIARHEQWLAQHEAAVRRHDEEMVELRAIVKDVAQMLDKFIASMTGGTKNGKTE